MAIVTIAVTYGWSLVLYSTNIRLPLVAYASFPTYIGYFALGCYIGKTKSSTNLYMAISVTIVGLVLAVLESYHWLELNPENNWLGLKASVQLLAFGVIMLLFTKQLSGSYKQTKISKIIEWCGEQSLPIYMTHMIILLVVSRMPYVTEYWITNWSVVYFLDIILIQVLSRFTPKILLPYLGIR